MDSCSTAGRKLNDQHSFDEVVFWPILGLGVLGSVGSAFIVISAGYIVTILADPLVMLVLLLLLLRGRTKMLVRWEIVRPADERLAAKGKDLARKMGVRVPEVYTISSARAGSADAFQIGSRSPSIVVSDILVEGLSESELGAILAHELAHARKKHVLRFVSITTSYSLAGVNFLLLNNVLKTSLLQSTIVLTTGLLFLVSGTLVGAYMRRIFEFEADRIAVGVTDPRALISALEKLATLNRAHLPRSRSWLIFHPPLIRRIERLRRREGTSTF